jgi:hypothetical protein
MIRTPRELLEDEKLKWKTRKMLMQSSGCNEDELK